MSRKYIEYKTFQSAATGTGTGNELNITDETTLVIFITGTSTSRTIQFKGKDVDGNSYNLVGTKIGDVAFTQAVSTTGTAEAWEINVTGMTSVYMNLSAVAGGNVTVKGKAV